VRTLDQLWDEALARHRYPVPPLIRGVCAEPWRSGARRRSDLWVRLSLCAANPRNRLRMSWSAGLQESALLLVLKEGLLLCVCRDCVWAGCTYFVGRANEVLFYTRRTREVGAIDHSPRRDVAVLPLAGGDFSPANLPRGRARRRSIQGSHCDLRMNFKFYCMLARPTKT